MDSNYRFPASAGSPLVQATPERVNQQRKEQFNVSPSNGGHSRDSSVHDKVAKFDSLASQSKALERKAADAALKRAMLGREEAESEMRKYRDEVKALRKQVEDGRDRERKVGERLETVMENYGRAKETHAHTQALWEKEIRRTRKESFRSQSVVVKLQEELKAARNCQRTSESDIEQEKERSKKREQEAFAARYQLVGVQEELANMIEKIKLVEQERDALKTIAKNEEIARIAAEGQLPLPSSKDDDNEFASPRKVSASLPVVNVVSSAASEEEIEQLKMELAWERRRAEKAYEHAQYVQVECQFRCCSCRISERKGDNYIHVMSPMAPKQKLEDRASAYEDIIQEHFSTADEGHRQSVDVGREQEMAKASPVFIPSEGVFRTVTPGPEESPWISPAKPVNMRPIPLFEAAASKPNFPAPHSSSQSRTPSCEPPTYSVVPEVNTSLLSLIDGSSGASDSDDTIVYHHEERPDLSGESYVHQQIHHEAAQVQTFHTIFTTTKIPLADSVDITPPALSVGNDALSPTMSREEALAQIRERRGRARSLAQGLSTPKKPIGDGSNEKRDFSAPAVRSGAVRGRAASRN